MLTLQEHQANSLEESNQSEIDAEAAVRRQFGAVDVVAHRDAVSDSDDPGTEQEDGSLPMSDSEPNSEDDTATQGTQQPPHRARGPGGEIDGQLDDGTDADSAGDSNQDDSEGEASDEGLL